MQHTITIIAAISKNLALGRNNELLYHLPDDMKNFKNLTTGNTIIMGRKTFESFPKGALPNRENIVISRNINLNYPNTKVFSSIEEAIENATNENIYIIGGGQIYKETIKLADKLVLTYVDDICENADTFFPDWKLEGNWVKIDEIQHDKDDKHAYKFIIATYKRISNID